MAPYVAFCEANVKGGVRCALSPKTFLWGPSATGKGAVLNTVELALTGKVSDVQGRREIARDIDLIAHLHPDRKGELLARVLLSTGEECMWRAGGKTKKSLHVVPPVVDPALALPLRPVYEAVTGAVETARKFFLEHAVGAVSDRDVLALVPAALHAYYNKATMASTLSTHTAVDRLLSAMEHAKKRHKDRMDSAKAARKLADENAQGLPPLPTEADEKALREAIKEAEKRLDAVKARATKAGALATVGDRLHAARRLKEEAAATLGAAMRAYEEAQAVLLTIQPPPNIDPSIQTVVAAMRAHAAENRTDCLVCGSGGPHDFATRVAKIEAWFASVLQQGASYHVAAQRAANAEVEAVRARQALGDANAALAAIEQASAPLAEAPPTDEERLAAEQAVTQLREKQRSHDVLKASWAGASKAKDNAQQAEDEAHEWEKLQKACAEAVAKLLDNGVTGFNARVQKFLPDADQFRITMREGNRAVFQFGLVRDGNVRTALSGAEWARVMAAMAAVCTPKEKVAVVIPEDRGFDSVTLRRVLEAFTHIDAQVLIGSPTQPEGGVPEGWTIIDTTKGEHRQDIQTVPAASTDGTISEEVAPAIPLFGGRT